MKKLIYILLFVLHAGLLIYFGGMTTKWICPPFAPFQHPTLDFIPTTFNVIWYLFVFFASGLILSFIPMGIIYAILHFIKAKFKILWN